MNALEKFLATSAKVDQAAITPLPNSRKVYVQGSRADILVPMREVSQSDTPTSLGGEKNPPIFLYDCSGPYTDPTAHIDIRAGLAAVRQHWIEERQDTEVLQGLSSFFGQERASDPKLDELRFPGARNDVSIWIKRVYWKCLSAPFNLLTVERITGKVYS